MSVRVFYNGDRFFMTKLLLKKKRGTLPYSSIQILVLFMVFFMNPWLAQATSIDIGQGNRIFVPMKSFKALRDEGLIKQAFDYSCGAAALATLLTYGVGDETSEKEILLAVMEVLSKDDAATRKKEGLSLLDLKKIALARGHKAQGFRLSPEFLPKLKGPVLVFIQPRGYKHFAVLKGIRGDRAYLADPSRGNVRIPMYEFLEMWLDSSGKGILFVVERRDRASSEQNRLKLPLRGFSSPEILSARQLLEVGDPNTRLPRLQEILN